MSNLEDPNKSLPFSKDPFYDKKLGQKSEDSSDVNKQDPRSGGTSLPSIPNLGMNQNRPIFGSMGTGNIKIGSMNGGNNNTGNPSRFTGLPSLFQQVPPESSGNYANRQGLMNQYSSLQQQQQQQQQQRGGVSISSVLSPQINNPNTQTNNRPKLPLPSHSPSGILNTSSVANNTNNGNNHPNNGHSGNINNINLLLSNPPPPPVSPIRSLPPATIDPKMLPLSLLGNALFTESLENSEYEEGEDEEEAEEEEEEVEEEEDEEEEEAVSSDHQSSSKRKKRDKDSSSDKQRKSKKRKSKKESDVTQEDKSGEEEKGKKSKKTKKTKKEKEKSKKKTKKEKEKTPKEKKGSAKSQESQQQMDFHSNVLGQHHLQYPYPPPPPPSLSTISSSGTEDDSNRSNQQFWMEKYEALKEYQRKNGHANPSYLNDSKLYSWLHRQKNLYRKDKLPADRYQLLVELGVHFDYQWDDMYQELKAYRQNNPQIDYTSKLFDQKFTSWIYNQILSWKANKLPSTRFAKLQELGITAELENKLVLPQLNNTSPESTDTPKKGRKSSKKKEIETPPPPPPPVPLKKEEPFHSTQKSELEKQQQLQQQYHYQQQLQQQQQLQRQQQLQMQYQQQQQQQHHPQQIQSQPSQQQQQYYQQQLQQQQIQQYQYQQYQQLQKQQQYQEQQKQQQYQEQQKQLQEQQKQYQEQQKQLQEQQKAKPAPVQDDADYSSDPDLSTESKSESNWLLMYKKLKEYKKQNNTCSVPMKSDKKLSLWVRTQRKSWREGKLHEWKQQKLEKLGLTATGEGVATKKVDSIVEPPKPLPSKPDQPKLQGLESVERKSPYPTGMPSTATMPSLMSSQFPYLSQQRNILSPITPERHSVSLSGLAPKMQSISTSFQPNVQQQQQTGVQQQQSNPQKPTQQAYPAMTRQYPQYPYTQYYTQQGSSSQQPQQQQQQQQQRLPSILPNSIPYSRGPGITPPTTGPSNRSSELQSHESNARLASLAQQQTKKENSTDPKFQGTLDDLLPFLPSQYNQQQ